MMPILNAALPVLGSVLDKVIPDPKARDKAKLEVQRLQQEGELKGNRVAAFRHHR